MTTEPQANEPDGPRDAKASSGGPHTPAEGMPAEPTGAASRPPMRRRRLELWLLAVSLFGIFTAQAVKPWTDNQLMNLVTYVLTGTALLAGAIWSLRRDAPPVARWLPIGVVAAAGLVFLLLYRLSGFTGEMVPIFEARFSNRPLAAREAAGVAEVASDRLASWPQFLGPNRNGVIERREFSTDWSGAEELWRITVGKGWSGFAVVGDYAVTMEQRGEGEEGEQWVTCYDVRDGQLTWSHRSSGAHYHVLGGTGPRATPTIFQDRVYAQTAVGRVFCLDVRSGDVVWEQDLLEMAGLDQSEAEQMVTWGRAGSPLIVPTEAGTNLVVVPSGEPIDREAPQAGHVSLIAFDAQTGSIVWRGGTTQISYASPVEATLSGVRQIVSVNESNVTGHSIEDGSVLWEAEWFGASNGGANCSNPTIYGDDGVLVSKGYGGGAKRMRVGNPETAAAEDVVKVVWEDPRLLKTKFTHPVLDGPFAYALSDGTLTCVDLRKPKRLWMQPRGDRYRQGQLIRVEDTLVVQTEPGDVALVACDPEGFRELARLPALQDNTWNVPTIVGTLLLVRSNREAVAYRLPRRNDSVDATASDNQGPDRAAADDDARAAD